MNKPRNFQYKDDFIPGKEMLYKEPVHVKTTAGPFEGLAVELARFKCSRVGKEKDNIKSSEAMVESRDDLERRASVWVIACIEMLERLTGTKTSLAVLGDAWAFAVRDVLRTKTGIVLLPEKMKGKDDSNGVPREDVENCLAVIAGYPEMIKRSGINQFDIAIGKAILRVMDREKYDFHPNTE